MGKKEPVDETLLPLHKQLMTSCTEGDKELFATCIAQERFLEVINLKVKFLHYLLSTIF